MTLVVLQATNAANVPRFSVVGSGNVDTGDISHAALLASALASISMYQEVPTHHVRPPLVLDSPTPAHVVAWLDLDAAECQGIADLVEELRTGAQGVDYWVPVESRDEITGRSRRHRFNCASFVAHCYREGAGIRLLVDDAMLPEVDRALLERVWTPRIVHAGRGRGLTGAGPWRVLLPGYVLNALRGGRPALPFQPSLTDATVE